MKVLGEPIADSDVVNQEPRVLLIGYGWVGQYCGKYFKNADIYRSSGFEKQTLDHYDLGIISVPTKMDQVTGQCDTTIVEEMVKKFKGLINYFLIKSTVEIGTTELLKEKYAVNIAMSPEYIGETLGHPLLDARRDAFQIIGGDEKTVTAIARFWESVLHSSAPIMLCTATEAEIIKYCENYWITQRVDYWNDVYEICTILGGNFERVREGLVLDPRLNRTHSNVYPHNRGWSGKCLPKDMNALAYIMRKVGFPLETLECLIKKNKNYWRSEYKNQERLIPEKPLWI
jgi:UDPglucose 6-dehydrogenase